MSWQDETDRLEERVKYLEDTIELMLLGRDALLAILERKKLVTHEELQAETAVQRANLDRIKKTCSQLLWEKEQGVKDPLFDDDEDEDDEDDEE